MTGAAKQYQYILRTNIQFTATCRHRPSIRSARKSAPVDDGIRDWIRAIMTKAVELEYRDPMLRCHRRPRSHAAVQKYLRSLQIAAASDRPRPRSKAHYPFPMEAEKIT